MSKLAGRKPRTTPYSIGDVIIELKQIPFGRVLEIQKEYAEIVKQESSDSVQLDYIQKLLLEYTDLDQDDISGNDYALTIDEATGIFQALMTANKDPKAPGLQQN
jgi:hypothetical protein